MGLDAQLDLSYYTYPIIFYSPVFGQHWRWRLRDSLGKCLEIDR